MRKHIPVLLALILLGFIGLGVHTITHAHQTIQFKEIQLKSTTTDLLNLQIKYDLLNNNLKKEIDSKDQNQDKIKQLEQQKKDLEEQRDKLQRDLQAKAEQKSAAAQKVAQAASLSATAYAGSDAKSFIYSHESGNNPGAINKSSGACGLGQALPCSKMPCSLTDYGCQDSFFTKYMVARYGSWEAARTFWIVNHWW